jgi:hypothetical protein
MGAAVPVLNTQELLMVHDQWYGYWGLASYYRLPGLGRRAPFGRGETGIRGDD